MWKSYKSGGEEPHANQLPPLGCVCRESKPAFICTEHTLGMKNSDYKTSRTPQKCVILWSITIRTLEIKNKHVRKHTKSDFFKESWYDLFPLAEQNVKMGLIVQVSASASGCPWRAQTLGSSAGSPAAWSPPAHTEKRGGNWQFSTALLGSKMTRKPKRSASFSYLLCSSPFSTFSWNTSELKTLPRSSQNRILVSSSPARPDLLQLLLPLAELRLQVGGPPLSHLLLPVQLQPALLQHSLQLRLLLQQQAPAPSTRHKHSLPCWALKRLQIRARGLFPSPALPFMAEQKFSVEVLITGGVHRGAIQSPGRSAFTTADHRGLPG